MPLGSSLINDFVIPIREDQLNQVSEEIGQNHHPNNDLSLAQQVQQIENQIHVLQPNIIQKTE